MKVSFHSSFARDLRGVKEATVSHRVKEVIEKVEAAQSLQEIENIKKLHAATNSYRIRIGECRLGFVLEDDEIVFVRCLNRRDFYKHFP